MIDSRCHYDESSRLLRKQLAGEDVLEGLVA